MSTSSTSPVTPNLFFKLIDTIQRTIRGERHLPPWWLRDVGGSDFEEVGQEFLSLFRELVNLQPDDHILEIGCGSGRMAIPLSNYLNHKGSYTGMDIVAESIVWCQTNISTRHSNFHFLHTDLYNKRYNPGGHNYAKDYVFPFDAGSFDFIFLTSVFTHLLPDEVQNYLKEIKRLLKHNGRSLITAFLLNEAQQNLASQGKNNIDFKYGSSSYKIRDKNIPESAVAYEESFLRQLILDSGLMLAEPIYYGKWSGRGNGLSYQDILLTQPA